jgi:hypothetical protein
MIKGATKNEIPGGERERERDWRQRSSENGIFRYL